MTEAALLELFPIGARVCTTMGNKYLRKGAPPVNAWTVIGPSKLNDCVRIIRDGTQTPYDYNVKFLAPLTP